jgi:hypothetical protein
MSFKTDKIYETTLTSETEKKQETSKVTKPKSKKELLEEFKLKERIKECIGCWCDETTCNLSSTQI